MYAFKNPETDEIDVYDDLGLACCQAFLVGQHFICCFDEDEPYVAHFDFSFEEGD